MQPPVKKLTVSYQGMLAAQHVVEKASPCKRHDFQDTPLDRARPIRRYQLQCHECGVVVPVFAAFLYEQGVTHGANGAG